MKNYDARLKNFSKRLKKRPLIDPVYAIQQIFKFIDMSYPDLDEKMKEIKEEERISLYEFVYIANYELTINGSTQNTNKQAMWAEIEQGIRKNNGFKPDEKDELALKIKLF